MGKHGVLVISHGSRDLTWVARVDETVEAAKTLIYKKLSADYCLPTIDYNSQFPIISSYLELVEGRLIQDGINTLQDKGVTHIHVLPLFVSEGSTHVEEIKQAFGFSPQLEFIGDLERLVYFSEISFDLPLIDDDEIITILHRQLRHFEQQYPGLDSVLLLGHGSTDKQFYALWEQGMKQLIAKLKIYVPQLQLYYAGLLPDTSRDTLVSLNECHNKVVIIPVFISAGYFTSQVIPSRLAGLSYAYSGETLLPSEEMVALLVRRFSNYFSEQESVQIKMK